MRKYILIVFAAMLLPLMTSCTDNREIDSFATVMAIGVDGGEEKRNYTFAVADTGSVSGESKGDGASLLCFSAEGRDIEEAISILDARTSKKLSFSHLSAIVFSKESAAWGMYEEADYLKSKMTVRPQTILAAVNISAQDFLKGLNPSLEVNPEKYFENVFRTGKSYVSTVSLSDFYNACHTKTLVFMPLISAQKGQISEENAYVSESLVIEEGRAKKSFEAPWLIGLIESKKEVTYGDIQLGSFKKPDTEVYLKNGNMDVYVHFTVRSDKEFDITKLCRDAEYVLNENAMAGYDIMDARAYVKRKFYLQESYENFDFYKALKNARFHVTAERVEEKRI